MHSPSPSTQFVRSLLDIKDRPCLLSFDSVVLNHPTILSNILALKLQDRFWCNSFQNEVVIAMWTVFITFFELFSIFPESFLAFLADECLCAVVRGGQKRGSGVGTTISVLWRRGCDCDSAWHSAQSNHFRPVAARQKYVVEGSARLFTAWCSDGDLSIEDVLAMSRVRLSCI